MTSLKDSREACQEVKCDRDRRAELTKSAHDERLETGKHETNSATLSQSRTS
jgi:hypothetical protein